MTDYTVQATQVLFINLQVGTILQDPRFDSLGELFNAIIGNSSSRDCWLYNLCLTVLDLHICFSITLYD